MMRKEAMKLALEALETERENYQDWDKQDGAPEYIYEAITALREALAEQPAQQEPVAWMNPNGGMLTANYINNFASGLDKEIHNIPLCTSPPAQRKPLTDEQIIKCWGQVSGTRHGYAAFARAIEAAHGIKENT